MGVMAVGLTVPLAPTPGALSRPAPADCQASCLDGPREAGETAGSTNGRPAHLAGLRGGRTRTAYCSPLAMSTGPVLYGRNWEAHAAHAEPYAGRGR